MPPESPVVSYSTGRKFKNAIVSLVLVVAPVYWFEVAVPFQPLTSFHGRGSSPHAMIFHRMQDACASAQWTLTQTGGGAAAMVVGAKSNGSGPNEEVPRGVSADSLNHFPDCNG